MGDGAAHCEHGYIRIKDYVDGECECLDEVSRVQPPLTDEEGAAFFGARLVGCWKSSAPLARAPHRDDPEQTTVDKINDFDYVEADADGPTESLCPFTAHIRKMVPRTHKPFVTLLFLEPTLVVCSSMPYGPEVDAELEKDTTAHDRGSLFSCYQLTLGNGFLAQQSWLHNEHRAGPT